MMWHRTLRSWGDIHTLQRHTCSDGGLLPSHAVTMGKTNIRTTGNSFFVFPALGTGVCWLGLAGDGHCRGGSLGAAWAGGREQRQQSDLPERPSVLNMICPCTYWQTHYVTPPAQQLLICMHHHSGHDYCWHDMSCIKGSFRRDCVSWIKTVSFYPKENAMHQVY